MTMMLMMRTAKSSWRGEWNHRWWGKWIRGRRRRKLTKVSTHGMVDAFSSTLMEMRVRDDRSCWHESIREEAKENIKKEVGCGLELLDIHLGYGITVIKNYPRISLDHVPVLIEERQWSALVETEGHFRGSAMRLKVRLFSASWRNRSPIKGSSMNKK